MSIGNPISLTNNVAAKTISASATPGQTLFTITGGYRINQLSVYRNGTRLVDSQDYTARDGATVTLLSPASGSDVIEFQIFDDFRVADALDVNSGGTVNGNVTVNGTLSATSFSGNINAVDGNFTGNVSIAGTLTYEDVTNIDSVGLITARSGIELGLSGVGGTIASSGNATLAGIVTAAGFVGNVTGNVTGDATGLSGTPNLNVGIITATEFVGSLTGTASTASFATTSFGLSGSPTILVSSAGVNTTSVPTNLYVSGSAAGSVVGLGTTDANTTLDFSTGNNFSLTLTGSIILANPTGVTTGQSGIIQILQSTGSHTVGFGSHWDFPSAVAPTLSTGAGALDCLTYFVRSSTSIITNSLIGIGTL